MKRLWLVPLLSTVLVLAALSLVMLASYRLNEWSGGERHELASWIEALATTAAFTAAVVAAVIVGRTYRIERLREDRFDDTQRRQQASLIAAWPDGINIETGYRPDGAGGRIFG